MKGGQVDMEIYGKIVNYITEEVNRLRNTDRVCKQISNTYEEKGLLKAYEILNRYDIPFVDDLAERVVIDLEFLVTEIQAYSDAKAYQHATIYEIDAINKLICYIDNIER